MQSFDAACRHEATICATTENRTSLSLPPGLFGARAGRIVWNRFYEFDPHKRSRNLQFSWQFAYISLVATTINLRPGGKRAVRAVLFAVVTSAHPVILIHFCHRFDSWNHT